MEVKLAKLREEDLEMVAKWRMLPEITKFMYTDPIITPESQRKWFKLIKNDDSVRYWVTLADNIKVGLISLTDIDYINKRCYIGHYIADINFKGKGLSKTLEYNIYEYIFYNLKLNKLCFEILSFNKIPIKLHKKFGSEVEGVLKQHIYKNGTFYDVVCMGITKDKWNNIRKQFVYDKIEIEE